MAFSPIKGRTLNIKFPKFKQKRESAKLRKTRERDFFFFFLISFIYLLMRNKAADMGLPWMLIQMSLIMRLITSVPVVVAKFVAKPGCPDKCGDL